MARLFYVWVLVLNRCAELPHTAIPTVNVAA